jgi:hypothetical protein
VVGVVIVLGLGLWIVILERKTALSHPRSSWSEVSKVDNNNSFAVPILCFLKRSRKKVIVPVC